MKTPQAIIVVASLAFLLAVPFISSAATVTYTMQTGNFNANQGSGGGFHGFYNNNASEIGLYANSATDSSFAAFQTFTTTGVGSGTARALQVGDTFTLTGFISANPPSRIGLAFRSSTTYTSFNQIDIADEAKFQLDSSLGWKIYNGGAAIDSGNGANADATLTIKVTSAKTFNATVVRSGNTFNAYDVPMITGAGASITSFGVFAVNSANDTFWKNGSLSDSGSVEFGTGNGSSTVSGLIADGLAANSTSTVRANALVKNGTGIITLSNSGNTYSGGTTISAGTLSISSDGNLGATTGGVTINNGSGSVLSISSSLTLNAGRTITIGSGGGKLDAGANTLTIAGTLTNTSGNNHLFILANGNTTVSGNATGTGDIVKQGTGTLTLNGSANTFGTATANMFIDNGVVQGSSSAAFGQTASGGGVITMGASGIGNNGATTLLLTSAGASVTNAINARYYSGFNASKTIGGNNASGTVTFSGSVTLNDSVNLSAAVGSTVAFNGVIQVGSAGGTPAQSVNGTPGITTVGGGIVVLGGNNTYAGATTVSNGTLLVQGSTAAGSAVSVVSGATVGGTGAINGTLTVNAGGTLAPGNNGIGILTNAATPSLGGTVLMEINRSAPTNADKLVRTGGGLTYGGALVMTNIGAAAQNGDTFTLFNASSYGGTFSSLTLPPGGTAHWKTNNLVVDGSVTFTNANPVAANLTLGVAAGGSNTLLVMGGKHTPTDADGDTVTITGVTQGANGTVSFAGTNLTYTSTNSASSDSFTYTVSDGIGGTDTKTVTVSITNPEGFNRLSPPSVIGAGTVALSYLGVPGVSYALDWATNLTPPINWQGVLTNTAASDGSLRFTNTSAATENYFRTRYVGP